MVEEVAELCELILLKKLLNSFELSKLSTGFLPVILNPIPLAVLDQLPSV